MGIYELKKVDPVCDFEYNERMKKVAALILNRNLPELTDEFGDWIKNNFSDLVDIYGVENGSDPDKHSRYARIVFKESFGPAKGINEALKILMAKDYEYFWVNFNDARYYNNGFIREAIARMEANDKIGLFNAFWSGNNWLTKKISETAYLISFFSDLGFVVSKKALEVCSQYKKIKLDPLRDSTNFSNHNNALATSLALYEKGMWMATDERFEIYEKREVADDDSEKARGFDDATWKNKVGPRDTIAWLERSFPEAKPIFFKRFFSRLSVDKIMREKIIKRIENIINTTDKAQFGF